jgi:hypothetical protein
MAELPIESVGPGMIVPDGPKRLPCEVLRVDHAVETVPPLTGRPCIRLWSRRTDTNQEGYLTYGPGALRHHPESRTRKDEPMNDQYRMTDRVVTEPTCIRITVERLIDDDPDLSWLDQTDDVMGEGWQAQADERKERYNDGDWQMLGIRATATWLAPMGGASILQTITSGGLWGIESDSDPAYLAQIEDEQIEDVRQIMTALRIDHTDAEVSR